MDAGTASSYTADAADLADWVHLAFTDAFLTCQQAWGGPIPGGPDAYVGEWATSAGLMGVADPPTTVAELRQRLDAHLERGDLRGDDRVHEVVSFLRRPPLPGAAGVGYRLLFEGAVATIPRRYRRLLGVRRSILPVVTGTRVVLAIAGRALASGSGKRAQDWARDRLRRLASA